MENLTWEATTDKGNTYIHTAYSDPYPGRKGSERITSACGWCSGTGVYQGPSGYKFHTPAVGGVDTGCFRCEGRGYTSALVSSLRASERRRINASNKRAAEAADDAAEAPARQAAELLADWDAALAEQARRDAKPKGFVAEVGTRLRQVPAKVTMIRSYESQNFVTGAPELGWIVKFDIEGKTAIWFSAAPGNGFEVGDEVVLSGTVKKYQERDGEDQTVLSRCIIK